MKITPIVFSFLVMGLMAEDKQPAPSKALSAEDAITFVEAAALKFQSADAQKALEAAAEAQKKQANASSERFDAILAELRKKAGLGPECNPTGTGDKDPAKRYVWQCGMPEPAKVVAKDGK